MLAKQQQCEDFGDYDSIHKKSTTRVSSPSTTSCLSIQEFEESCERWRGDSEVYAESEPDSFLEDAVDQISLAPLAPQLHVKVKNMFLNISIDVHDETHAPSRRRRAVSAPPAVASTEEQEVLSFHGLSSMASPRGWSDMLPDGSWSNDRFAMTFDRDEVHTQAGCVAHTRTKLGSRPWVAFVPCFGNAATPTPARPPMQTPKATSRAVFENPDAAALWQRAQQAELAATALRDHARLERARDQGTKSAGGSYGASTHELECADIADTEDEPTCLMLKNIPNDLTREMLLKILDSRHFQRKYDFVYLPIDFAKSVNLGYAFVNMVTHSDALRMQKNLDGFCSWRIRTTKKCEAVWSKSQGNVHLVEHYRNSRVMHKTVPEEFKPLLFRNGERVTFPAPTRRLKPLREFSDKKRSD